MKTIWHKSRSLEIDIKCPICGHQTATPKYLYCAHTLFVFLDSTVDDPFFDFMRQDFSEAWQNVGLKKPTKKSIESLDLLKSCEVWDVTESSGYHPVRIVIGYGLQKN